MQKQKSPALDWSNPEKALGILRHLISAHVKADKPQDDVEEIVFEAWARDGTTLPIKVFRSANSTSEDVSRPLIVLYFPGGYIMGEPGTLAPLARLLVQQFNAVVAAPTYRLAPEHPFPTAANDGWDTLLWISKNANILKADASKGFIVGGISSGGNIANAVAHLAIDRTLQPPVTGVWLSCAGARVAPEKADLLPKKYVERMLSRSQEECTNNATSSAGMDQFKKDSIKADVNSPLWSPLIWSTGPGFGHKGFPKTYSQVAGMDPPRDESLVFDDMLKAEGIATRLDLYAGVPHFFFYMFKDLPQSKGWEKDTLDGFTWLLE